MATHAHQLLYKQVDTLTHAICLILYYPPALSRLPLFGLGFCFSSPT